MNYLWKWQCVTSSAFGGLTTTICQKAGSGEVDQGNSTQDSRVLPLAVASLCLGQSWWEVPKHLKGAFHVAYFKYEKHGENEVCTLPPWLALWFERHPLIGEVLHARGHWPPALSRGTFM